MKEKRSQLKKFDGVEVLRGDEVTTLIVFQSWALVFFFSPYFTHLLLLFLRFKVQEVRYETENQKY